LEKLWANSYPKNVLAMFTRTNDLAAIVRTHYEQYGLFKTVTGILKGSARLCFQKIINPLLLGSDSLFERYYLTGRTTLSDLEGRSGLKIAVIKIGGIGECCCRDSPCNRYKREMGRCTHLSGSFILRISSNSLSRRNE